MENLELTNPNKKETKTVQIQKNESINVREKSIESIETVKQFIISDDWENHQGDIIMW